MGKLFRRLHHLLNRNKLERELDDEMSAHREMMPPTRLDAFGNALRFRDESRDVWGWLWFDHLWQDLNYAARGFARERRFTLSAFAAITLAVGAATAVFSVVDRSLFRPLPYQQGGHLVSLGMIMPNLGPHEFMFSGAYRDWRVSQSALDLTSWSGVTECDLGGDAPQRLSCASGEATFLPTLGESEPSVTGSLTICGPATWREVRDMKKIEAVIRKEKLEEVKVALQNIGIEGMTATRVEGHGRQKGHKEIYNALEYETRFLPRTKLEVVVPSERAEEVIATITTAAKTGKIGDGKIFVSDITDVVRIRNDDRDEGAL